MDAEPTLPATQGRETVQSPFQIRGLGVTLLTMRVIDPWNHDFFMLLGKTVSQSPGFYRNAPVVLDLEPLAETEPFNLAEFVRRVRQHQLVPVGVVHASDAWEKVATNAGLSVFPGGHDHGRSPDASPSRPRPATVPTATLKPPMVVSRPVRSGQQIYAPESDLVILASVSHGAELLADGSIHVYGPLRGRALAGVAGVPGARIFCKGLEAELVSIDGTYMVADQIPKEYFGKSTQLYLDEDTLIIKPLS